MYIDKHLHLELVPSNEDRTNTDHQGLLRLYCLMQAYDRLPSYLGFRWCREYELSTNKKLQTLSDPTCEK